MVPVASAEFCSDVGQKKAGVAAGDDDAVTAAVVEAADHAAPCRYLVDLIKKEPRRVLSGELSEGRKKGFHIFRREIAESVILKIQEQDIVPAGESLLHQAGDHLIHDKGFSRPAGSDDGQDLRQVAQVCGGGGCIPRDEDGEGEFLQPLGNNVLQDSLIHSKELYHDRALK